MSAAMAWCRSKAWSLWPNPFWLIGPASRG